MYKEINVEEKLFMLAGLKYAEISGLSRTKLAWGLASILGRSDSAVYNQLSVLENEGRKVNDKVWQLFSKEERQAQAVRMPEEEMELKDDVLEQHIGEIVKVTAVSVRSFGIVCTIENTTRTLLLHVSEIANDYIEDVSMYVEEGDEFLAMLIMSEATNKLALSTRRVGSLDRKQAKIGDYIW